MTPHIEAKKDEIAKIVIVSGDPKRSKYIAENYLTDYKLVNQIRGMYAYTGYYKNKKITVMGHGMGMAGAGIYFYELFKFYDVESIIRIGTCGTSNKNINLLDIILAENAYTESNYAFQFSNSEVHIEKSSNELNEKILCASNNKGINIIKGTVLTSDVFDPYIDWKSMMNRVSKNANVIATEMESFALFHIAKVLKKQAACILTVTDSKFISENIKPEDREKSLNNMIEIALNSILL